MGTRRERIVGDDYEDDEREGEEVWYGGVRSYGGGTRFLLLTSLAGGDELGIIMLCLL